MGEWVARAAKSPPECIYLLLLCPYRNLLPPHGIRCQTNYWIPEGCPADKFNIWNSKALPNICIFSKKWRCLCRCKGIFPLICCILYIPKNERSCLRTSRNQKVKTLHKLWVSTWMVYFRYILSWVELLAQNRAGNATKSTAQPSSRSGSSLVQQTPPPAWVNSRPIEVKSLAAPQSCIDSHRFLSDWSTTKVLHLRAPSLPVSNQTGMQSLNCFSLISDIWLSAFICAYIFGGSISTTLLDVFIQTWSAKVAYFLCASPKSQRNGFWWNSLPNRGLWKIPEDLVCLDLCTSNLSGIPYAGLCLHRGCSSTSMSRLRFLSGSSSLFELQPQLSVCRWWSAQSVLHSPLEPQWCCCSWQWTSY